MTTSLDRYRYIKRLSALLKRAIRAVSASVLDTEELQKWDFVVARKLFISIFLISAFFVEVEVQTHDLHRHADLTLAITEYGTFEVNRVADEIYAPLYGSGPYEKIYHQGKQYININPGVAFLAVPWYGLVRLSLTPYHSTNSLMQIPEIKLAVAEVTTNLATAAIFAGLLVASIFLSLRRMGQSGQKSLFFALLLYFGTMVAFSSKGGNNGQTIVEAGLVFTSFCLILIGTRHRHKWLVLLVSGILVGYSATVNHTGYFSIPLMCLLAALLYRSAAWYLVPGIIIGILPLILYEQAVFGHVFAIGATAVKASDGVVGSPISAMDLFSPDWQNMLSFLYRAALSLDAGIFLYSPFLAVLVLTAIRNVSVLSKPINIIILGFVILWLVSVSLLLTGWAGTHGGLMLTLGSMLGTPGPRYILPILPFIVFLVAQFDIRGPFLTIIFIVSCLVSVLINAPGLLYTGFAIGQSPLNYLVIYLKNGLSSSLYREIHHILGSYTDFNLDGFVPGSLLAVLIIILAVVWLFDWMTKTITARP